MSALYVAFRVSDAEYVLPAAQVTQMESFNGATPVPGVPPWVTGLIHVRGQVIPVVDVRLRFGLPHLTPLLESRVVVVQHGTRSVGLLVDTAREVLKLAPDAFVPAPELVVRTTRGFVKAVIQAQNRLLLLIDVERIIGWEDVHGNQRQERV